jgi:hypothetical protein
MVMRLSVGNACKSNRGTSDQSREDKRGSKC